MFSIFVILVLISAFIILRKVTDNPGRVVENFYSQWISSSNPLSEGVHKNNKYLSDGLINTINQVAESSLNNAIATDPVLCSLDKPSSYQVSPKDRNDDTTTYVVTEKWSDGRSIETLVDLKRFGVLWKINGITCAATAGNAPAGNENADIETKVAAYVRDNISNLSPEKEVLGGKYQVTDLAFTGDNTGTVSYEDGHVAHTAIFSYSITETGEVNITSFEIKTLNTDDPKKNSGVEPQSETSNQ